MPRKIYHDRMRHRYVRSNSFYGHLWIDKSARNGKVPYAPSWRRSWKPKQLIKSGGKP